MISRALEAVGVSSIENGGGSRRVNGDDGSH